MPRGVGAVEKAKKRDGDWPLFRSEHLPNDAIDQLRPIGVDGQKLAPAFSKGPLRTGSAYKNMN